MNSESTAGLNVEACGSNPPISSLLKYLPLTHIETRFPEERNLVSERLSLLSTFEGEINFLAFLLAHRDLHRLSSIFLVPGFNRIRARRKIRERECAIRPGD